MLPATKEICAAFGNIEKCASIDVAAASSDAAEPAMTSPATWPAASSGVSVANGAIGSPVAVKFRKHGHADRTRALHLFQGLSRDQRKTVISVDIRAPGQGQSLCRGYADTHPGKAARTAIDENPVGLSPVGKAGNGRNQFFGMATPDFRIVRSNQRAILEQGDGTGNGSGIDREKALAHQPVRSDC